MFATFLNWKTHLVAVSIVLSIVAFCFILVLFPVIIVILPLISAYLLLYTIVGIIKEEIEAEKNTRKGKQMFKEIELRDLLTKIIDIKYPKDTQK